LSLSVDHPVVTPGRSLWRRVASLAWRQLRTEGVADAVRVLLGAVRVLGARANHARLYALPVIARHIAADASADLLFHVSHRHFLASGLSFEERLACALSHFTHESEHCDAAYLAAVYQGDGLLLWQAQAGGVNYTMRLRSTPELRHEGPVSVVLLADGQWLHETSFAWVDGRLFQTPKVSGHTLFVTRNQSLSSSAPALSRFRQAFPQNSPSYFCLAAVHGVAQAHGQTQIAGIFYDRQIAFDKQYELGFRRSYCEFWATFGGSPLLRLAMLMPVPARVADLESLKPKHRARAKARRAHWAEISAGTAGLLSGHRRAAGAPVHSMVSVSVSAPALASPALWLAADLAQYSGSMAGLL
jgi:uncharacterized protein VirK/YbjX